VEIEFYCELWTSEKLLSGFQKRNGLLKNGDSLFWVGSLVELLSLGDRLADWRKKHALWNDLPDLFNTSGQVVPV